jgi:hypothetical protein
VLAVIAGFLFLLPLRLAGVQRDELIIVLVFLGAGLLCTLSASAAPITDLLRACALFWILLGCAAGLGTKQPVPRSGA